MTKTVYFVRRQLQADGGIIQIHELKELKRRSMRWSFSPYF